MAQPLYVFEAVDVRRADEADSSRAITIKRLVIPPLKRKTAAHAPGGGVGEVNHAFPQIDPVEPVFDVAGIDADVLSKYGFASGTYDKWVFAGAVRNKQGGNVVPFRAVIQGLVAEWTPDEFTVGEMLGCSHAIQEVTHYELQMDNRELFYWDYYEREGRSGGVSWFSEIRQALGG